MRSLSRCWRAAVYALPLACATFGLLTALHGRGLADGGDWPDGGEGTVGHGETGRGEGSVSVENPAPLQSGAGEPTLAGIGEEVPRLTERPASESSRERFMADLDFASRPDGGAGAHAGEGGPGSAAVTWRERSDIPEAAEGVLREYVKAGGSTVATSGYLDLRGNVWGAILRNSDAWCDVVLVSTEDGSESAVRVVRFLPGTA